MSYIRTLLELNDYFKSMMEMINKTDFEYLNELLKVSSRGVYLDFRIAIKKLMNYELEWVILREIVMA